VKERQPPVKGQNIFVALGNKKIILPTKNQVLRVAFRHTYVEAV
jgi:hypothetical protein